MTNDLWDILQNNPSLQTDLDEDTIAVATSGSDSTKRISIRGGSFHKVVDGKEVSTVEDDYMKVIIVKMAHVASRTYYEGAYEEGKPVAPVAVVLPDNPSGDVMQMILPATSVFGKENSGKWPFRPYVQMLANNSVSAGNVVTKMQFDLESSIPKLYFSPAAAVNAKDVEILKKQAKSSTAEEAIKMNVYKVNVNKSPFNKPKPILNENDIDTLMDK